MRSRCDVGGEYHRRRGCHNSFCGSGCVGATYDHHDHRVLCNKDLEIVMSLLWTLILLVYKACGLLDELKVEDNIYSLENCGLKRLYLGDVQNV